MLCCKAVAVEELAKPAGVWCTHCVRSKGCAIYDARPAGCRDFYCEWMLAAELGPEWKPDRAKFLLAVTDAGHFSFGVDPGFPAAWRQPPYYEVLRQWARMLGGDPRSTWPAVDVWIGKRCIVLLAHGEQDLGIVGPGEEITLHRTMTAAGPTYLARKVAAPDRTETLPPARFA
jgi:hypothetical protein